MTELRVRYSTVERLTSLLRLSHLAPEILGALLAGRHPIELTAILCLLVDRDSAPVPWLVVLLELATLMAVLRIGRTILVLEQIIMLVTKRPSSK